MQLGSKMRSHEVSASRILLVSLLLVLVFPVFVERASAETELRYYWVTVNPTTHGLIMHSPIGWNWTISFQALWTYGNSSGQVIGNATVPIEVRTNNDTVVETLWPKTNATGTVSFYFSSPTPKALTFTPTKLVTRDGVEWNSSLHLNGEMLPNDTSLYGFQSKPITIYWDSFDTSLISTVTSTLGVVKISVNITYFMIPQEGLTVPQLHNQSHYDYIPKYVHGADVKINGLKAEESSVPGVYAAETSTWFPTACILVKVSQEGWPETHKALSFAHNANEIAWTSAAILGLICAVVLLAYRFVSSRKTKGHALFTEREFPIAGALLLVVTSLMSMYWALVGVESVLNGFDWMFLAIFGMIAFAFGLAGSVMSKMRRNFTLAIIAVCFPLLENTVVIKFSFDNYQLAISWIAIASALIISVLSGVLIGRSDEEFS